MAQPVVSIVTSNSQPGYACGLPMMSDEASLRSALSRAQAFPVAFATPLGRLRECRLSGCVLGGSSFSECRCRCRAKERNPTHSSCTAAALYRAAAGIVLSYTANGILPRSRREFPRGQVRLLRDPA